MKKAIKQSDAMTKNMVVWYREKNWDAILEALQSGDWEPNRLVPGGMPGESFPLLSGVIGVGATDLAKWLIAHGALVDQKDNAITPLMEACAAKDNPVVEALLRAGANPNLRAGRNDEGVSGETALMLAAQKGNLWAVRQLLRAGAAPAIVTSQNQTAVYYAVVSKKEEPERLQLVRDLVSAGCPLLGNELHEPVYERSVLKVELLLKLGCPVNERLRRNIQHGPRKGETPLTLAVRTDGVDFLALGGSEFRDCKNDRLRILRALLAAGADPNMPDAKGWVPLMIVEDDESEIKEVLLKAGADPGLVNQKVIAKRAALKAKLREAQAHEEPGKNRR